jgi:Family of unknown function (DUF6510)
MEALDGNAVAGRLVAAFGVEMTTATATCGNCGRTGFVGEVAAYLRGPGTVLRCRNCDNVLVVLTEIRGIACVGLPGVAALDVS